MLRRVGGRGYRIGIVNPATLVGKEIVSTLRERGFPAEEVRMLGTSGIEEGTLMEGLDEPALLKPADEPEFQGLDLVFFCGDPAEVERWIPLRDQHGFLAIDMTQPSTQRGSGVEAVAEINSDRIGEDTNLILSPHPVTTALTLVLHPILASFEIEACNATILEPASEMDQRGIDEMFAQAVAVLNVQGPPTDVFGRQAAHNVFPAETAASVEAYVAGQIEALTGGKVLPSLQFLRGSTFHSHSISLFLQLGGDVLDEELASLLDETPGLSVAEPGESYGTLDGGGRDEILIGRIQADPNLEGAFWLYLVADNLRRSSALNAVLVAESLVERFGSAPN